VKTFQALYNINSCYTSPSPGVYRMGGGQKTQGGTTFLDKRLGVCSNWGAKHEMGWLGTTGPPLETAMMLQQHAKRCLRFGSTDVS